MYSERKSSQNDVLAGGGRVCGQTFPSCSYLRTRLCSQSRVCVPVSCKAMRSGSPLASRELTTFGQRIATDSLGGHPRSCEWNRGVVRGVSERGGCECEILGEERFGEETDD